MEIVEEVTHKMELLDHDVLFWGVEAIRDQDMDDVFWNFMFEH